MTPADVGPEPLSPDEQDFLRALARALVFVPRVFMADLGRAHGLSTSEYFALMHVSEAPQGQLRMGDLAAATALSLGAVTRVVKLLEGKGLLERRPSTSDGRVHEAVLTEAGYERLARAEPAHVASVRRRIFDKLDGLDLRTCATVLSRISQDDATPDLHERSEM